MCNITNIKYLDLRWNVMQMIPQLFLELNRLEVYLAIGHVQRYTLLGVED